MAFVLVHGGSFTSACWDPVLPYLKGEVLAVDLPGRGRHPADLRTVTVSDWAASVAADVKASGLTDVVLVGHSMAGITLPRVLELIPDLISRVVFVSCSVPRHGQSLQDALNATFDEAVSTTAAEHAAGDDPESGMSAELATAMFCNDMDAEQTALTLSLMVPDAMTVLNEPMDLSGLRHPIPRSWVRLTNDAIVVPATQDIFIDNLGETEVIDLDAGHMAMLSRPEELAGVLNTFA